MNRRKLLQHLEKNGCAFEREGGGHTIYVNTATNQKTAVPRHREIHPDTVRRICKQLDIPHPGGK